MKVLKVNSKGPEVKRLQSFLGLKPDGIFGEKTEAVVKQWQASYGLESDGIVGEKTWNLMFLAVDPSVVYYPIYKHITKATRKIKYIVIHFTAGSSSKGDSDLRIREVFLKRDASADFVVDDDSTLQVNPDPENYFCWAVGDGKGKYGITNKDCISIEMCSNLKKGTTAKVPNHSGWYFTKETIDNTIKLTKILMKRYGIDSDHVIRHYDATKKLCPGIIGYNPGPIYDPITSKKTDKLNNETEWNNFKQQLI